MIGLSEQEVRLNVYSLADFLILHLCDRSFRLKCLDYALRVRFFIICHFIGLNFR